MLRILDGRGQPVGVGFLVSDTLALTCAHVVSAALGATDDTPPAPTARIRVDLPLVAAASSGAAAPDVTAAIDHWAPPLPNGGGASGSGDVAVLRLSAPLPGAGPVRLVDAQDLWEHSVRAFGLPAGRPGGLWHAGVLRARQADGWVQADLAGNGYPVSRGFSGTPVWDDKLAGVVGMITVAESSQPPVSYLIPTSGLLTSWPELRGVALPPSPFRGLSAFEEADATVFYGRRAESDGVAQAVDAERWVTVVGPSGCGKSSLALAGVVPRLRAEGASVVILRPASGSSPLSALAAALLPLLKPDLSETQRIAQLPELSGVLRHGLADPVDRLLDLQSSRRLVIIVDQLEELFDLAPDTVDELADVLFDDDALPDTVRVLSTLRADFLEPMLTHQRLGPAVGRHLRALGPLDREGLRDVVTAPVEALPGVCYEAHLADRILTDTGAEQGALPLLALTLDLLWQRQERGLLTHQAYEELGGVTGALSNHADRVWAECVPSRDEEAAQGLFTQLIRVPLDAAAATRRIAHRTELSEDQWRIAQRLAARTRLLVTGRDAEGVETVELTHEALISKWGKLATWVAEDRSYLMWRESVRQDKERWEQAERAPELLPTAAVLAGADQWLHEHGDEMSEAERAFLESGLTHRRTRVRRRAALLSGLGAAMVLVLVLSTLFVVTRRESQERAALGASRALAQAAQDESPTDPVRGVMLSLAAYETATTQEARNEMLQQYLRYQEYDRVVSGGLGAISTFDKSRDGNVVLAVSEQGRATLLVHAITGQVRSQPVPSAGQVQYVMVSADGKRAAYIQEDGKAAWMDVHAEAERPVGRLHRLPDAPGIGRNWSDTVTPSMSLDGRVVVAHVRHRVVWWKLDSGQHGASGGSLPAPKGIEFRMWPAPDDRTLLVPVYKRFKAFGQGESGSLLALDLVTGKSRVVVRADADQLRLSGDRTAVVVCHERSNNTVVSVHRVSDGTQQGRDYHEKDKEYASDSCNVKAVDRTGRRVVLESLKGLSVVDTASGQVVSRNALPSASSSMAKSNPVLVESGGKLYYTRQDESLIGFVQLRPGNWTVSVSKSVLTHDGKYTLSVLADGSRLQVHHARTTSSRVLADAPRTKPYWVPDQGDLLALDRTGRLVADREGRNVVTIRDSTTLRRTATVTAAEPPKMPSSPGSIAEIDLSGKPEAKRPEWDFSYFFDHDGNLITLSGTVIQQWDARTGRQLARFDARVFRPKAADGTPWVVIGPYPAPNQVAVIVVGRPGIRIVDITKGRTTATVKTGDDILSAQFDGSGQYFAILRRGSVLELWRRGNSPRKELGPLRSIAESANTPFFAGFLDGDGRYLIAANNAVRIYRIDDGRYEDYYAFGEQPSSVSGKGHTFMDASKDGRTLIHIGPTGDGGPLVLDPARWHRELCEIIGHRQFTAEELSSLPMEPGTQDLYPKHS
ncbi:nSTAND1 domain-containing NTPase [Streptomyces lydicus]